MTITTQRAGEAPQAPSRPITWGWALKRAALGTGILIVAMGVMAWLTYASIDPALDRKDEAKDAKGVAQSKGLGPASDASVALRP